MRDGRWRTKEGFRLIGLHYEGRNEQNELAELWHQFINRIGELGYDNTAPGWRAYGASQPTPKGFEYLAAVEWDDDEAPEGWVIWDVPANGYLEVEVGAWRRSTAPCRGSATPGCRTRAVAAGAGRSSRFTPPAPA